jgi:hypothetical protein
MNPLKTISANALSFTFTAIDAKITLETVVSRATTVRRGILQTAARTVIEPRLS